MLQTAENIRIVSVTRQTSRHNAVHVTYPHRIILRLSAVLDYELTGKTVRAHPGDMVFLPNSPAYRAVYPTPQSGDSLMINFTGELPDTPAAPVVLRSNPQASRLMHQIYRCWTVPTAANRCRCMAMLWELLALITESVREGSNYAARILDPAAAYLEKHIFDPDLRISDLHGLCGISDTYFRTLFEQRFGDLPKKYVTERRLSQAKAILESGEFDSVSSVARAVGFDDSLYFSKAYKARYGTPPSRLASIAVNDE